jgi:dihydroorotate dehydrogenase (NAD+) catalytic subunit
MSISVTQPGKSSLVLASPVMNAAGTLGFGDETRDLIDMNRLGAFVTNPVTQAPRAPAHGTHVISLDSGVLVHTGLPNPGLRGVVSTYHAIWERLSIPVILHLVINSVDEVRRSFALLEDVDVLSAVELGVNDEITPADAGGQIRAAREHGDKPILVRLPFGASLDLATAAIDAGADSLVVCAPPRGTARDLSGKLIAGRIYSPTIKPVILRLVGQIARRSTVPVIGAGGIHSAQDVRDYLEAGAAAVQVDSALWIRPGLLDDIAHDLDGQSGTESSERPRNDEP